LPDGARSEACLRVRITTHANKSFRVRHPHRQKGAALARAGWSPRGLALPRASPFRADTWPGRYEDGGDDGLNGWIFSAETGCAVQNARAWHRPLLRRSARTSTETIARHSVPNSSRGLRRRALSASSTLQKLGPRHARRRQGGRLGDRLRWPRLHYAPSLPLRASLVSKFRPPPAQGPFAPAARPPLAPPTLALVSVACDPLSACYGREIDVSARSRPPGCCVADGLH
jgi:hypothetical protein